MMLPPHKKEPWEGAASVLGRRRESGSLVQWEMQAVAQSGRGGNPSLENIPKSPVLFLPPVWMFVQ